MDFAYTDDQAMLADTVRRLFAETPAWSQLAELGLLALPFAESDGGLGLGGVETMIVGEAEGHAAAASAYADGIATAGTALKLAKASPVGLVGRVAAGETRLAWAHEERGLHPEAARAATARRVDGEWRLSGEKYLVAHGADADLLLVTASSGEACVVLLVDARAAQAERCRLLDGTPAATLTFDDAVALDCLAEGDDAPRLIERVAEHRAAYRAAEAVGLMQASLDATLLHLRTRHQFGQPLAQFQALRHKAAEMLVALEQARSMAMLAAMTVASDDHAERRESFSQIRLVVVDAARFVGQAAVQLHGGIGVTEEHAVGQAFRRLTLIDLELSRG
jgi:alkylation response protein AidB-like acyl-CoA dehydrogenase